MVRGELVLGVEAEILGLRVDIGLENGDSDRGGKSTRVLSPC